MNCSVRFRGTEIGSVSLEPSSVDRSWSGTLQPTEAYWSHRAELQTLTLGLAAMRDQELEQVVPRFLEAAMAIRAGNLELRDAAGAPVDTERLMVADYAPSDLPPALRGLLPIVVHTVFPASSIADALR